MRTTAHPNDDWISHAYETAARQPTLSDIIMDKIRFESGINY